MLVYTSFTLIWYAQWPLSEFFFLPFDPTPGVEGVCKDSIFAFMVLCAQFPLIWYATRLLSEIDMVWPFDPTPGVEGVSVGNIFATMMLLHALLALIWNATWPYSEKV